MPLTRYLLFLISFVSLAVADDAPFGQRPGLPVSTDYILHNWEIEDGLPSNRIRGIAQTPDGYLWLATAGGLARFDGVHFSSFMSESTPGLESDVDNAVFVDRSGCLWVGLDRGAVARREKDQFQAVVPMAAEAATTTWATSFAQDASGAVWFGYEIPILVRRWKDGQITDFSGRDGMSTGGGGAHENQVCASVDGTVWYANTDGCGPFDGKRFKTVDTQGGGYVHLARCADGGMWALRGDWLVRYHSDGSKETLADLSAYSVHVMLEDSSGNLWLGTNNAGLLRFSDNQLESVPVGGGAIASLFEDREKNLWVGTQSGGLNRLCARRFFLRQTADGLLNDDTYSLCVDKDRRLWIAGANTMLVRATDRTNRTFAIPEGWTDWAGIMTVCADSDGGVWVGTLSGLQHSRAGTFSRESVHEPVTALLEDRRKDLWVALIGGPLVRHRDGKDVRMPDDDGLKHVLSLGEDGADRIWAGTLEGLVFKNEGGRFSAVPLPGARRGDGIRFIVPDQRGAVWIGALRGGLYRWREGRVVRLPIDAGLPVGDLRSLAITPEGNFWVGTGQGLFCVSGDEMRDVMDGGQSKLHCVTYGRSDGLPSTEFSLGFRGTTARSPDGALWFATARGALEIKPPEDAAKVVPLPVVIESMQAGDEDFELHGPRSTKVPPLSGSLKISYTLPLLRSPEGVHFRYRLTGMDGDRWVDAGTQRSVTFPRLPPGRFRLEVSAAEAGETWPAGRGTPLEFVVLPAWWETLLFKAGASGAGLLALVLLVRKIVLLRVRRRIQKLEQEHALERERTRISRDIHDQLGANLTQIAITCKFLTLDPPEAITAHGREIAGLARRTAESLDEIVWAVNPHYDSLAALVEYLGMFAVEILAAAQIACEISAPAELPAQTVSSNVRHHLFLAVKESLNNVVKHSGAGSVWLQTTWEKHVLGITVTDDGAGFDPRGASFGANGIRNLGERMTEIGGTFRVESAPGKGTRVFFSISLPG